VATDSSQEKCGTQSCQTLNALTAISCSSTSLCVATDLWGHIVSSPDPSDASPIWDVATITVATVAGGYLSCSTDSFCLVRAVGGILESSDPTGGSGSWTVATATNGTPTADLVYCISGSETCRTDSGWGLN
jgi:hypothetical protein